MKSEDKNKLAKYFTSIHDYIIDEYDNSRQEIINKSNNPNQSFQVDPEQNNGIESIISTFSKKCKEFTKRMKSEEFKDEDLEKTIKKITSSK